MSSPPTDQSNNQGVPPYHATPLNDGDIESGLNRLMQDIAAVNVGFEKVANMITRLSAEESGPKQAASLQDEQIFVQCQNDWQGIQQRFGDLVHVSQSMATRGLAQVEQYRVVILPMMSEQDTSLEAKKRALEEFIQTISHTRESAKGTSQGYWDIRSEIQRFIDRIQDAPPGGASPSIQKLKKEISQLRDRYFRPPISFTDAALSVGAGATVGLFLRYICGMSVGMACGGAGVFVLVLGFMYWNRNAGGSDQNVIGDMCNRLASLGEISAMIRTHAQKIGEKIEMAINTGSPTILKTHVRSLATTEFDQLEKLLNRYANHVPSAVW